jgi:hypothetical protein
MVAINSHRGVQYGTVLVIGLVLVSAVGGLIIMPTAAAQDQNQSHGQNQRQRHTLVIIHVSGSPSWSITASGSIHLDENTTENTDSIGGRTASGSVGGLPWVENASDPKDVIYYTGTLLAFDLGGTGNARVTLDGKRVNPTSLKNTPTPTATATPTPTVMATAIPSPSPTASSTPTPSPTDSPSPSAQNSGGRGSGFTLSFAIAIAAVLVVVLLWWRK